jgi:hypothetical protein
MADEIVIPAEQKRRIPVSESKSEWREKRRESERSPNINTQAQ